MLIKVTCGMLRNNRGELGWAWPPLSFLSLAPRPSFGSLRLPPTLPSRFTFRRMLSLSSRWRLLPCNEGLAFATSTIVWASLKHTSARALPILSPAQCADFISAHRIWLKHLRKLLCASFALRCIPPPPLALVCPLARFAHLIGLLEMIRHLMTRLSLGDTSTSLRELPLLAFRLGYRRMRAIVPTARRGTRSLEDSPSRLPTLTQ